eukprot:TRINITY_DN63425_c0_g1_i1.p1 TRINITY_DN63425_c0_g1~~TRINITY_DN63425_c0_g1_i1.p1  ORF type:complete len:256 (-),score=46.05 TRINITY_DN63425_c0_g1_i1:227-922(-)
MDRACKTQSDAFGPHAKIVADTLKGDLRKMCFKTTYGKAHNGRTTRPEHASVHMEAILNRQAKVASVPNLGRSACSYSKEYFAKPAGDFEANKELARNNRRDKTSQPIDFEMGRSEYKMTYGSVTEEQRRKAFGKASAPNLWNTNTTGGVGGMMETRTSGHHTFALPDWDIARKLHSGYQVPVDNLAVPSVNIPVKSLHGDSFVPAMSRSHTLLGQGWRSTLRPVRPSTTA